ncbi:MAG: leucine-rich repeat domain-containing protein [Bacteroidales bacterium]|nr:leucine-rich repeat domain-containing protein [Bacteroidales bacterium]
MKKILLLLTLSLCSLGAWAQDFYNEDGTLKFTITGTNEVSVAAGTTAPTGTLVIPSTVENAGTTYTVTSLGYNAFYGCSGITSVTIPNTVTSIGASAFSSCSDLTSVTIGNSVTSIGSSAFNSCRSLTNVTIPNSVTYMGTNVFTYCRGLMSVTISNSISTIQSNTFAGCSNLTNVTIPNSVTSIETSAFEECYSLTSVTIPNSVRTIGGSAFYRCSGLTSVTIGNSVMLIQASAFENCSGLTSVIIPNSVRSIAAYAFKGCSGLTSVTIGNSVRSIHNTAFSSCSNLKTVYNLSSLPITTSFYGTSITRVVDYTKSGDGDNAIYQIPDTYSVVTTEDNQVNHIPVNTIPTNFIYKDGSNWKAKKIVLTDDTSRFEVPVAFTADEVTYTREFTNSNRSTLYLPFGVPVASMPEGLEIYEFSGFNGTSISFAEHTGGIAAYTPYLVGYEISSKDGNPTKCTFNLTNVAFPVTPAASTNAITNNGMTFQGTTQRTCMTSSNYGYSNGYFVQSGNGTDHTGHAHVNPFRCYFTYSANGPMGIPPTLDIDLTNNGLTGIETPDKPVRQNNIRYSDDVFDTMGRLVRKHAKDLEGLPRGIYIWKGKKVLHFND